MNMEGKTTRERILTQMWTPYVKDEFVVTSLIQRKTEVSYVADRIGGWIERGRI